MAIMETSATTRTTGALVNLSDSSGNGSIEPRAKLSVKRVLSERMTLSDTIRAANAIVQCYPNGGQAAGKGYIGALAATLGSYPKQIADRCASRKGIIVECKFLPTVADIVAWCERATAPLYAQSAREGRIELQLIDRERKPRTIDEMARIENMRLRFIEQATAPRPEIRAEQQERALAMRQERLWEVREEWISRGEDVPTIAGTPVSRELVDAVRKAAER